MASKSLKGQWIQFPYKAPALEGAALRKAWPHLHQGDREPWPDAKRVAALSASLEPPLADEELARRVLEAWRAFHCGDFASAWTEGEALGPLGAIVAAKAAGVYTRYLEKREAKANALLERAVALAADAARAAPGLANAHYMHAFVLGRLSQRTSILQALAAGHAGKVRQSLEKALSLEPRHADAHIALGLYHAEIVAKVGGFAARLTYGASSEGAVKHFKEALRLAPESAIAHLEYGNGLLAAFGEARRAEAVRLYERAAGLRPLDAMERLDVDAARAALG